MARRQIHPTHPFDPEDPFDPRHPTPRQITYAATVIDRAAALAAKERNLTLFTEVTGEIRTMRLTKDLRKTVWAYYNTRKQQLLAYVEDPHPYGPFRTDLHDAHAYVANGTVCGTQTERISHLPQAVRDALQYIKGAGNALVEPHPVHEDRSIASYLEVPRLKRQFNCPGWAAVSLQHFFLRLQADAICIQQYAQEAKRRGFESIFLELDWTSLQLEALNPNNRDALCKTTTSYEEGRTELGRFAGDDTDDTGDSQDDWPGTYEPIAYHKVHSDREPLPREYTHPWLTRLQGCTREHLPSLLKEAWQDQQQHKWNPALAGAFWLEAKIQLLKKAPAFFRWALEQTERITDPAALAQHGKAMWDHQKTWTSSEKKLFWTAYKERKAALTPYADRKFATITMPEQLPALPQTQVESSAA